MRPKIVTLTREELYEHVWTEPMTKVAARYGLSDVALKKRCVKANIPTPGLGHWAKLAAGQTVRRPRLPKASEKTSQALEFTIWPAGPVLEVSSEPPPDVPLPARLTQLHPAVRAAHESLETERRDKHGRSGTEFSGYPFRIGTGTSRRLFLMLEGLVRALLQRGHQAKYEQLESTDRQRRLILLVRGAPLAVHAEEKLTKVPYEWTKDERERHTRWGQTPNKRWEHVPSGILELGAGNYHWGFTGPRWRDTKKQRLEDQLGQIVLELEAAADIAHIRRQEHDEELAKRRAEDLAQKRRYRIPIYEDWLLEDLNEMLDRWAKARQIREFMAAYEKVMPDDPVAKAYLAGVRAYADRDDPLTSGEIVGKDLNPSDERLEEVEKLMNRRRQRY